MRKNIPNPSPSHTIESRIQMYDTDAAGILFFGNQFRFFNDAFESFFETADLGIYQLIHHSDHLLVIVHAEADFSAPMTVGDYISITATPSHIGTSSFTISYEIVKKSDGKQSGKGKTTHVWINKQTRQAEPLPEKILNLLRP